MATATRIRQGQRRASPARALPRRHPTPRPPRERRLEEARAREVRARYALAQAFATMERTHALAAQDLERFEAHLSEVRKRLRRAGYLGADRSSA